MSEDEKGGWAKTDKGLYVPSSYSTEGLLADNKENKTKGFFKTKLDWIINNLTIILLLPSFIGTIWQILELANINLSYIRFFSVTQVPVDGALFLLPTIITFFSFYIFKIIITSNFKKALEAYNKLTSIKKVEIYEKQSRSKRYIYQPIIYSILLPISFVITGYMLLPDRPIIFIINSSFLTFSYAVVLSDALMRVCIRNANADNVDIDKIVKRINNFVSNYDNSIITTILILFISLILLLGYIGKYFSENYVIARDLYNTQKIKTIVLDDFQTTDYKLIYMNDKYIFIRLCHKQTCDEKLNKKIVIYPTQKVLFD